jgi:hypothetical protein
LTPKADSKILTGISPFIRDDVVSGSLGESCRKMGVSIIDVNYSYTLSAFSTGKMSIQGDLPGGVYDYLRPSVPHQRCTSPVDQA